MSPPPPVPEDDESSLSLLERARKVLYGRAYTKRERPTFTAAPAPSVEHVWEEELEQLAQPALPPAETEPTPARSGAGKLSWAGKFFMGSFAFFFIAIGAAAFSYYFGSNAVSNGKIAIDVQGPATLAGGDTLSLQVSITNNNPTTINDAVIRIDFPEGTRSSQNILRAYPRFAKNLGTLESGETVHETVKAVIFGGAGDSFTLPISFSYTIETSNATFEKKHTYPLSISSTPLSISIDALSEVTSGQPYTIALTVRSNATVPISNVVVVPSFPFGFTPSSVSIPLSDAGFSLGTLEPGATRKITITGVLSGEENEERTFRFAVGTSKSAQDPTLAISYMTQDVIARFASSFISTAIVIDGSSSDDVALSPGGVHSVTLSYANRLATPVTNASFSVTVSGTAIDYDSIKPSSGFYNSPTHTVIFDRDTDPALALLEPGDSDTQTFTFSTLPAGISTPTVSFTTSVAGTRAGESGVPEQLVSTVTKTAKVATTIALNARASRSAGAFTETGPIPPIAEQPTSYTIVWNVQNQGNAIAGATVSATIPSYVTWLGETNGQGSFSYDPSARTVTWSVGDLPRGAGAQGLFQVSLLPSTSQRGSIVTLTGNTKLSAYDRFAGVQVGASAPAATTELSGDTGSVRNLWVVQ